MDILERIIENLTSDEVRRFKILSNRFKADEEKKLLVLFDYIRLGDYKKIEEEVVKQLYGSADAKSKNSYYRLRNKLMSNLEKSLLFYHFNYKNTLESHSNIQLATLFQERGIYREAYHYLKKAEKVALAHDQFDVLEVIYGAMVKLAVRDVDIKVDAILGKRRENFQKMELLRSSDEVLALILQQIRRHNFSRGRHKASVLEMLEKTQRQLEEHKHIFKSASGRISIYHTVANILLQKQAYKELEKYVRTTFEEFERDGVFDKNTHPTRLKMRVYRINALRKMLRFNEESEQIKLLWKELKMYNRQNFNEYGLYYFRSKLVNEKLLGDLKGATRTLKEAWEQKSIYQNPVDELLLLISQADQFFNQGQFEDAAITLKKILANKHLPKTVADEVIFFLSIFEIVSNFEAGRYQIAFEAHKKLKKKFKAFLKDPSYGKAQKFMDILVRLIKAELEGRKAMLQAAYNNFVEAFPGSEIADNEIIMYEYYLKAKVEKRDYYQVFTEEIAKISSKASARA